MAILEAIPGVEVTINSEGNPLPGYNDEEGDLTIGMDAIIFDGEKGAYYVECAGKDFGFGFNITNKYKPTSPCLGFEVYVDGQHTFTHNVKLPKIVVNPIKSVVDGLWYDDELRGIKELKGFEFTSFKKTDDESFKKTLDKDIETMKLVGKIVVRVYRVEEYDIVVAPSKPKPAPKPAAAKKAGKVLPQEVHEKALKGDAKSFGIAMSAAKQTRTLQPSMGNRGGKEVRTRKLDGAADPVATFYFKYRSHEDLQQLCIIPRTTKPGDSYREASIEPFIKPEEGAAKRKRGVAGPRQLSKKARGKWSVVVCDLTGADTDDSDDEDTTNSTAV